MHSLQVGHLVHLEALRELRLAEGCCQESVGSPCGSNDGSAGSYKSSPCRSGVGGYRAGCAKSR
jgi:hypothetical protein